MVTRLPGTFGKACDEIGTERPIGRAFSAGVAMVAQRGSNSNESSSPIRGLGSQAKATTTATESARRLNTTMSGWMNLAYLTATGSLRAFELNIWLACPSKNVFFLHRFRNIRWDQRRIVNTPLQVCSPAFVRHWWKGLAVCAAATAWTHAGAAV